MYDSGIRYSVTFVILLRQLNIMAESKVPNGVEFLYRPSAHCSLPTNLSNRSGILDLFYNGRVDMGRIKNCLKGTEPESLGDFRLPVRPRGKAR